MEAAAKVNLDPIVDRYVNHFKILRGDILLTRFELVDEHGYPVSRLRKERRLLTPVDLNLGRPSGKPFLRYSRNDVLENRGLWARGP
ncbi:MAG: hypothetical protein QNK37_18510 [Acidobacteriota bacterium]|nr:hypothetical protein [Acidobacteriota bacterium]